MRHLALLAVASAALTTAFAQDHEIRLVVKADDLAAAQAIDAGTIAAYKDGIVRATDIIVPGPWLMEAVRLLEENPGLDAGIHLTLTSEWESVKWRPLTPVPSLVDANGFFFPMVWPNKNFPPKSSLLEAEPNLGEVERELRAQIDLARRLLPRVSFLSCHMGAAVANPALAALTERLAAEYGLPRFETIPGVRELGPVCEGTDSGDVKARKLAARLETLGPGTWRTVDHAALDTPEMRAIQHEGYRFVAADRAGNVAAWTSPLVKDVVGRRGIRLLGYRDLIRESRDARTP
jgi:hypothetical protein